MSIELSSSGTELEAGAAYADGLVRWPPERRRQHPGGARPDERSVPTYHACRVCGRRACVHVLERYERGRPIVERFCLGCVDTPAALSAAAVRGVRPGLPVLAGASGLALLAVGLFGDFLIPDRSPGFGVYQQTGVVLAVLLGLVGILLRVGPVAFCGLFLLAASISADWFGLVSGPGIGWKQQTMIMVGAALAGCGIVGRLLRRSRALRRGINGPGRAPVRSMATGGAPL